MKLFELTQQPTIEPINPEDIKAVTDLCVAAFGRFAGRDFISSMIRNCAKDISRKLTLDGKIIGAYILGKDQLPRMYLRFNNRANGSRHHLYLSLEESKWIQNHKGIQGLALVVDPAHRGSGLGKMLIDYSTQLPYDYIWGLQMADLNNLNDWMKRRKLVSQSRGMNVTYARLR
jgi:GNAT superfamily N-acetyltransferase